MPEKEGREKTLRLVIEGLTTNPAYLLLFGLGILASAIVLAVFVAGDPIVTLWSVISWFVFLVGSVMVVAWNESKRTSGDKVRGIPDETAEEAYFGGVESSHLSGFWKAKWHVVEGTPHDTDDEDQVNLICDDASIFASSFDDTTKKTYWMQGRLSDCDVVTLLYWSCLEKGYSSLTGCVVLKVDDSFDAKGKKMSGTWRGMGKDGKIVHGTTTWEKLG